MKHTTAVEEEILDRFHSLMRHVADAHTPEFLGIEVTMPQAKVLYLVSAHPDTSMSALAGELGIGLSAVSGLVDRLVALGYIERREDAHDRRQQLVTVTAAGAAALERLRELNTEALRRLIAGLETSELEALLTSVIALDREVQHLDERSASTGAQTERTPA